SKVCVGRDDAHLFWCFLRGGDAVICLPDKNDTGGGSVSGMARISLLLGMRYLCLLCRNADWKAQNVSKAQSQKIGGRSGRRSSGSGASGRALCCGGEPFRRRGCVAGTVCFDLR